MLTRPSFRVLSSTPLVVRAEKLLSDQELCDAEQKLRNRHWLAQQGIRVQLDESGTSFELTDGVVPVLAELREKIRKAMGMQQAQTNSIRIRRYGPGNAHSAHTDHFKFQDQHLLVTAILYLTDVDAGGETRFVNVPELTFAPRANTLTAWVNYLDDQSEDFSTLHESTEVVAGDKLVAIFLFYGDKSEIPVIRSTLRSRVEPSEI